MAAETVVLTVCIPVALQQQLDTVAQAMERSRAWVIAQALEHFVAVQTWQVAEIHKALAEADAEDFAIAEEIAALNITYQSWGSSGFGALQEDPMEFHTEREEALYTTLKQVLQNHVSNHRIGYHETLSACVSVLGYVLYVMSDDWDEAPALIESTVAELKQRTHAHVLRALPTLPTFHDYVTRTAMTELGHDLGTALATFLSTAGIEHNMSVAATWRAYLSLVADVLAMPLYDGAHTPAEVDADIDTLRDELPVVMHLWDEEAR